MVYYNENDPKAAAWLLELIAAGHIAPGNVDERSIVDVQPADLSEYTQCHFFAGIGGWSYALRLAGWADTRPVWTGSCPCQPFSTAGKGLGEADARHLWPEFRRLIAARKPPTILGEQVASKAGREWLARVFADLEALEYSRAGADLCAAGVKSPQNRPRLFWVADSGCQRSQAGLPESMPRETRDSSFPFNSGHTGVWIGYDIIIGKSGSRFRVEPGSWPLAHGLPHRVGLLRGYGNAIVPQLAAEFIQASQEAINQIES